MVDWNRVYAKVQTLTRRRARWDAVLGLVAATGGAYLGVHARWLGHGLRTVGWTGAAVLGVAALHRFYRAWVGYRCVALLLDARVMSRSPPTGRGEDGRPMGGRRLTLDVREAFWLTPTGRGARVRVQIGHRDFRAGDQAWRDVREGMASSLVLLPSGTVLCRADSVDADAD